MREFKDRVERENSVGIHVRRRDFIDYRNTVTGNCEDKFYLAAISFFREKLETPRFYIFSDDITFCKNYFGQSTDIHYVKIIGGKYADIEEFFCLSWCRHKILTRGSSYGRMADVLNSNQSKITLYKGSEENKDNIIYLDSNKINQYAEIYAEQIENKGKISNAIDKHSKIDKEENKDNYFEDAKEKYDICEFKDAELTLLRGWQYGFRNLDYIFLYVNTLIKNQKFEEACLVATSYVKLGGEINNFTSMFPENMINRIINYSNSKMNTIVIIPCEPFKNGELNYLCNLGIMMQKMGCKVHYIFNEATDEDRAVDNEILNNNYMYTNCRGYKYNSRMYNKKIIEKQYDLSEFIREISNGEECTVITDDYSVLKSADKESFKKVFWNARNTYRMKTICKDVEELKGLGIDLIITEREQDNQDESIFKIAPIRWSYEVNGELRLYEQYKYSAFLYDVIDRIMLFRKTNL
jgi:hypothetical protein